MMNDISWDYNFENDSYGDNDGTIGYEQTELSKSIFAELFSQNGFPAVLKPNDGIAISVKNNNVEKDFLFDIMHNPNRCQPKQQAKFHNYNKGVLRFETIYHTIGNFAPVPRTIVSKNYGPNLQMIHRYLNELWPWFLKYMNDNWCEWPTKVQELLSFKEYMICSCQQMYYKNIFDEIYGKFTENGNGFKIDLAKEILSWNNQIKANSFDENLISFNGLFEKGNVHEIDNQIGFLIQLRGRCITYLIKKRRGDQL